MVDISKRGKAMPASPIRKLVPYAEAAIARGTKVHHLNIGQPDIATPDAFMRAYRENDITVLGYGHSAGLWSYREALSRYYKKCGIDVTKDEILVTTGGSEALLFTMMAILDPGDEVIVPEPFYTNYTAFAIQGSASVVPVTCYAENGFKLPPIEDIAAKVTDRTRAIVLNNPNNPTGYVCTPDEIDAIAKLCIERDLFLISDEVYREFVWDGFETKSVMNCPGLEQHAIIVDSVSKRYSACGARVGCIVTRNEAILDATLKMGQARLCPPTIDQLAAEAAVDVPDSYFEEVSAEYTRRRDCVFEALSKMEGVVSKKSHGAFYCVAKLPIDDGDKFCQWMLETFDHGGETVMMAPASGFYATEGLGRDEVRIAYVLCCEDLERAMAALAAGLEAYPGRKPASEVASGA